MYGKCLCGSVEFEISGEAPRIYQCHCSLCRKVSGSSSNSAMLVSSENFCWVSGENHISRHSTSTGFKSFFCGNCGSPAPNESKDGKMYWVPAGLLEEPLETEIAAHVYVSSAGSWDNAFLDDSVAKYSEMPEAEEFIKILNDK